MGPKNLLDMIEEILGKKCEFETHESAYRTEVVHHFTFSDIDFGGVVVPYPMKVCFDSSETDFMHFSSLKSVKVLGQ